jgi:hypothetical protein
MIPSGRDPLTDLDADDLDADDLGADSRKEKMSEVFKKKARSMCEFTVIPSILAPLLCV